MCALVGDEATLDFRTASAHERMRADMREVAAIATAGGDPEPALIATLDAYLGDVRGSLLPARREVLPAAAATSAPAGSDDRLGPRRGLAQASGEAGAHGLELGSECCEGIVRAGIASHLR